MKIFIADDFNKFAQCIMIRTQVFVVEQNIAADLETDEFENLSTHYLVSVEGRGVATARSRLINNNTAKIERVAVLKQSRGKRIGYRLMSYILTHLQSNPEIYTIQLGSQKTAISFYEKLGFQAIGEEYLDAGIPHRLMMKEGN